MKLAILKERTPGESRVAITPDTVKRYVQLGVDVAIESDAGFDSYISDEIYETAGAKIYNDVEKLLADAEIILSVRPHAPDIIQHFPEGSLIVGMLEPHQLDAQLTAYSQRALTTFSLELLPRISRAQSMDVLSSQSNLAGYRAVVDAVQAFVKAIPMMMTAAGTVTPAKVLVLGAGVAGLQAIATAKRLGAVVSAFDVRPAVKEQVESLGGKFIEVKTDDTETAETKGGYAREMSDEYKQKQQALLKEAITKHDIVITTALIPGKPAPVLITEEMVTTMKPGSIIVDLATASGGNCEISEADEVVVKHGVTLIGHTNMPSRVAVDASQLYARNLYNFVSALLLDKEGNLAPQWDDELVQGTLLTKEGQLVHPNYRKEAA